MMHAEAAASLARGEALTETSEEENESSAISDDDDDGPPALERAPPNAGAAAALQRQPQIHEHQGPQRHNPHRRDELRLFPGQRADLLSYGDDEDNDEDDDRGHEADMDDTSIDSRASSMMGMADSIDSMNVGYDSEFGDSQFLQKYDETGAGDGELNNVSVCDPDEEDSAAAAPMAKSAVALDLEVEDAADKSEGGRVEVSPESDSLPVRLSSNVDDAKEE